MLKIGMITCNYCMGIYDFQMPQAFDWGKMEEKHRRDFDGGAFTALARGIGDMGYRHLEVWEPHFSHMAHTTGEAAAMSEMLHAMGFQSIAYCIGGWRSGQEGQVEPAFRFAHALGADTMTGCIPPDGSDALLAEIERCGKKLGMRFALENHPAPNLENPLDILNVVGRYETIGANMDVGILHETGYDVLEAASLLRNKIHHVHLKDTVKGGAWPIGGCRPIGEGEVPIAAFLGCLHEWDYPHMVSVEFESAGNPTAGLISSLAYTQKLCLGMQD